jgi:hypothetical protein
LGADLGRYHGRNGKGKVRWQTDERSGDEEWDFLVKEMKWILWEMDGDFEQDRRKQWGFVKKSREYFSDGMDEVEQSYLG